MPSHIKKDRNKINRRQFIAATAAGTMALSTFRRPLYAQADKIKIGLIGCGWYGMVDLKAAFKVGGVECIALCDVDSEHLDKSAREVEELQGFKPQLFKDYRELLDVSGLQAVFIATPPHWHALPFLAALEKVLDIYCEKPLAYDIREGQVMVQAAKKSDRMIQIGFQRRQAKALQEARDFIQAGNLGDIVQVDVRIHYNAPMRDATPQTPPESLDWDAWCGPAPKLPYSPNIGHFAWRLEKAYGHGHLVDWGIHLIDATRWILQESMPTSVRAFGGIYKLRDQITTPDSMTANFDFATCPVTWRHRLWGAVEVTPETNNGIFFFGEKGTVFASDRRWIYIPNERGAERQVHEANNDAGTAQVADFLDAVKTRNSDKLHSTQDGFFSTATTQLGMIAYESDSVVNWDVERQSIVNNPKAAELLKRDYRAPWEHPFKE
ncbi:gfo/Idh/MocA family oxidoreductase [candidate division KSB1 bacterium]|nr:Gfo/Idh/MocA family oxidoreductase [candidate division KSB1 bacterium]RQW01343.1 MAG: gfo/Idh/MocA family oxidoreductase [candidate division KSB1 bacterium]